MHTGFVLAIVGAVISALLAFQPSAWVWALGLLWALLFGLLNYDHHRDRVHILNGLKRRDNALLYTRLVDGMLGALKRMLSPSDAVTDPMPAKGNYSRYMWLWWRPHARDLDDLGRLQASTLSWPVMDAALKVAVIYPLLLILIQWGITGEDTGIGTFTVLFAEQNLWIRAAVTGLTLALLTVNLSAWPNQLHINKPLNRKMVYAAFAFAIAVLGFLASRFTNTGILIASFSGVIAIAGMLSGASAITLAVSVAFVTLVAVTAGPLVADGNILALTFTASLLCVLTLVILGAVVAAVSFSCSRGSGGRAYLTLVVVAWVGLIAATGPSGNGLPPEKRAVVFALGFLPLINAVFDYLSYGITLGLIRYGRRQRNLLTGLVWLFDGFVAELLLIGLGLALSGTIALINHLAGQDFIALRTIYDDLKTPERRADYTWLTLTLLSTLVPTLVHLVLVFLSAFTWVPQRFKHWIARGIEDNEAGDLATLGGSAAAATIGALWAGFVVFGLWAICLFVTAYIEPVGLAVLGVVESVSLWLGWVELGKGALLVSSTGA